MYKNYKTKSFNDIYPLTIIVTRLGVYVIFQDVAEREFVQDVQNDEEISHDIVGYLHRAYDPFCPNFGLGMSLEEAFSDYQERELKNEENNQ